MRRLRPRISILSALLLMTIVGMAIVIVLQWRKLGPLRAEVRQARTHLGRLSIDDDSMVQAVRVRLPERDLWRWRVYLPPGGQYRLLEFGGALPARTGRANRQWLEAIKKTQNGIGKSEYSGSHLEGEVTIEASLSRQHDGWKLALHPFQSSSVYNLFTSDWLSEYPRAVESQVSEYEQKTFKKGEPILLLLVTQPERTAAPEGGTKFSLPMKQAEGIAIWLEQQPP